MWSEIQLFFRPNVKIGKKCDQSDFDHGMIVGARQGSLSISEIANLVGFSHTVSIDSRELCKKQRYWREGDSNTNNSGMQKSISGHAMCCKPAQLNQWGNYQQGKANPRCYFCLVTFMNPLNMVPCVKRNHTALLSVLTLAWNVLGSFRVSLFTNGALLGSRIYLICCYYARIPMEASEPSHMGGTPQQYRWIQQVCVTVTFDYSFDFSESFREIIIKILHIMSIGFLKVKTKIRCI